MLLHKQQFWDNSLLDVYHSVGTTACTPQKAHHCTGQLLASVSRLSSMLIYRKMVSLILATRGFRSMTRPWKNWGRRTPPGGGEEKNHSVLFFFFPSRQMPTGCAIFTSILPALPPRALLNFLIDRFKYSIVRKLKTT